MPDKRNQYSQRYDIDLSTVTITAQHGEDPIDITKMMSQVHIYENLFSDNVSGTLLLSDGINLKENLPIVGREKLHFVFRTPGFSNNESTEYIDRTFTVYKRDKITRADNEKMTIYRLHFIDDDFFVNNSHRIQKSYHGKISDIMKSISAEYIPGSNYEIEETSNNISMVVPNWTPYETMKWLSNRSITTSEGNESNFIFYADLHGHHVKSVSSLQAQEPKFRYHYLSGVGYITNHNTDNLSKPDINTQFFEIESIDPSTDIDAIGGINEGSFASSILIHDITTKEITGRHYQYNKEFAEYRTMYDYQYITRNDDLNNMVHSSIVYLGDQSSAFDGVAQNNNFQNNVLQRKSQISMMDIQRLGISTSGNHNMRPGIVIDINVPYASYVDATKDQKYDETLSGKYLVSSVHHIFDQNSYRMKSQIIRDSRMNPIPEKSSFDIKDDIK